jgi:hypothetical protein
MAKKQKQNNKKREMANIPDHKGNANQNHVMIHIIPVRMAIIKNTNNSKCW